MTRNYNIFPCASTREGKCIHVPENIKSEDARAFYLYKKEEILQDCIDNPGRYLKEVI